MGGGLAMRVAAKVVGKGIINPGLLGFPAVPTAEHSFTSTARKATRPVASICSSSDTNIDASAQVQKPCVGGPMPRLVFGGTPTLQEAEEATLDVAYLSPDMLVLSNSEHLETNAVPNHAIQAIRLLQENSSVKTVVASIASDLNIFHAVMNNEAVVEYLHSQKIISDMDESTKESAVGAEILGNQSPNCFDDELCNSEEDMPGNEFCNSKEDVPRNGFKDFFQNIKARVKEEMNSISGYFQNPLSGYFQNPLSGYFQNLFGGSEAVDGSDKTTFTPDLATFMGLAVMVIMVVVLKRP